MGDAAASDETFGWHFRGARVVRAVISDLVATQQFNREHLHNMKYPGDEHLATFLHNWFAVMDHQEGHPRVAPRLGPWAAKRGGS